MKSKTTLRRIFERERTPSITRHQQSKDRRIEFSIRPARLLPFRLTFNPNEKDATATQRAQPRNAFLELRPTSLSDDTHNSTYDFRSSEPVPRTV
jgi:hypothetical protein